MWFWVGFEYIGTRYRNFDAGKYIYFSFITLLKDCSLKCPKSMNLHWQWHLILFNRWQVFESSNALISGSVTGTEVKYAATSLLPDTRSIDRLLSHNANRRLRCRSFERWLSAMCGRHHKLEHSGRWSGNEFERYVSTGIEMRWREREFWDATSMNF